MSMEYGLIGGRLGHSFSKEIHEQIASYTYELKELAPDELDGFMKAREFRAINVTIPYKQDVIPYLDWIDPGAEAIGAVNTVVNREGKLYGYNTDFAGMKALVRRIGVELQDKKVLILGTGGTSRTARAVAFAFGAGEILTVSRKKSDTAVTYQEAETLHSDAQYIINTTPCGMYPETEQTPIDLSRFPDLEGVLDVIYNPLRSRLVLEAQELEIPSEGGLYMLAAQAVYACGHFLDWEMRTEEITKAYKSVLQEKRNLVLCGMPSCGKTTVGKQLAEALGRKLIDTDELIVEKIGMPIAEYSELCGEKAFRDMESTVIREAAKESGAIIATGGGAILREENVRALKQNGFLFFIDRPLELLTATPDRPFSSDADALRKRYEERYDIYCHVADSRVDGSGSVESVSAEIIYLFLGM